MNTVQTFLNLSVCRGACVVVLADHLAEIVKTAKRWNGDIILYNIYAQKMQVGNSMFERKITRQMRVCLMRHL